MKPLARLCTVRRHLPVLCAVAVVSAACGDDAEVIDGGSGAPSTQTYSQPLYIIQSLIFGAEGRSSYVIPSRELVAGPPVSLAMGREFPEYSPADAIEGKLAVGSGESPSLSFFSIADDGVWTDEATLSFSNFTSQPLAGNVPVGGNEAYVPFDTTNHARYDVTTFTITGEVGAPADVPLVRDGLNANRGFGQLLRDGELFQPYYYADSEFRTYGRDSIIQTIDTLSDAPTSSQSVPCPHLHITSADDDGNLYFSNGQGSIAAALLSPGGAPNCFARINAGESTVDPASITAFRDLTGGREGSNLFYIGGGKALFNVYHAERDALSADSELEVVDMSSSYHLWTLDLATGQAAMLEGVDFAGGQFTALRVDGRTIVTIPAANYASTTFYDVTPDLVVSRLFEVEGWAFKTFRLR